MQAEQVIAPITPEWYKPYNPQAGKRSGDRSLVINVQLGLAIGRFYGKDAISACMNLAPKMDLPTEVADAINDHFFEASRQIYNLPGSRTFSQSFYMEQHKGAIAVPEYFGKLVPELKASFELKDEIKRFSDRPSDLLRKLSKVPPIEIDPTLAYEVRRHAILLYQLGIINSRSLKGRLLTVLSDIQNLLNQKLFVGPEGHGEDALLQSFHDDESNTVVGFPDRGDRRPLTAHLKALSLVVRRVDGMGVVLTGDRKKDDKVAIIKSWVKALDSGGRVHIDKAVQDSIGMTFTLMDDSVKPEELADLVVSVIQSGVEASLVSKGSRKIPRIMEVEKDDFTDADHGQSPQASFKVRRKIWFKGITTPVELIFRDRETYLNSELEVGERDPETGLYLGRAHDLFELRRALRVVRVPFPEEVYDRLTDDRLYNSFVSQSKQVAFRLRSMHKAA